MARRHENNHHDDEKNKHCKDRKRKWGRHHRPHCHKPPVRTCHESKPHCG